MIKKEDNLHSEPIQLNTLWTFKSRYEENESVKLLISWESFT